jgi:predicted RNA-binding Zn-ribbon protein involved in translation (DUF1610 family)
MAGKGEEAVIVGGIDQQSYNILNQFGIRVFGGYQGKIMDALRFYRQARISQSPVPGGGATGAVNTPFCPTIQGQAGLGNQNGMGAQGGMANQAGFGLGLGQNCPMPFVNAGWGALGNQQDIATMGSVYPNFQNSIVQGGIASQAAFPWQQQGFVCPNCNWRMKCARQNNSFPDCPNCGMSMALDMKDQNNTGQQWWDGQWAAATPAPQAYTTQTTNVPNCFLCPNCKWKVYGVQGANQYFRCPNCGQVGAAGQQPQMTYQPVAQVAYQPVAAAAAAPAIPSNSQMGHAYRGVCTNCHQIMTPSAGTAQSGQSLTAVIPAGGNSPQTQQAQNAAQQAAFYGPGGCVIR